VSNINLGPLANNGGPTQTMLPLPGSPAICGGIIANASGLASDQRGFSRTTTYGSTSCVDSGAAQTNYALAFTTDPPSSVLAGIWISPAPVVRLTENGMSAVAATNTVSLTDSASLLNGSTSVALSSGSASYYDLLISAASASDSLTATLALTPSLQIPTQSNTFQVLASSLATLTSPTPGSTLTSTDAKFTWSAVAGVSLYDLHLSAIGPGGADLYFSGSVSGTSVIVTGIPANGAIIYARLYSFINGAWQHTDSTYTEATLGQLTVPSPGSTLTGGSIEFTWSRAPGISIYDLHLSTIGPGGADLYASGGVSANSLTVPGIPLNGAKVYARLYSWFNGGWEFADYTYTEGKLAQLTSPAPSSTLTATTELFKWTAGVGVAQYDLHLSAVAPGGYDLYVSGHVTGTSTSVSGLPTNGETIYARLYSVIEGVTLYNDYTFTSASVAKLISPVPSSTLTASSESFTWSAGSGVSQYELYLSAIAPGDSDLYSSGHIKGTSATVSGIPINGETVYARLYSVIDGATLYNDYTFTTGSLARLISPMPGTALTATTELFKWTAGTGVTQYDLHLSAIAAGGYDLYVSGHITGTSIPVYRLPTNGETIYARLYSVIDGATYYNDYTYTAK
jgi:hypothetical protein